MSVKVFFTLQRPPCNIKSFQLAQIKLFSWTLSKVFNHTHPLPRLKKMSLECGKKCQFFTHFQICLYGKDHLNEIFHLEIAKISLQKHNFRGLILEIPHFFHACPLPCSLTGVLSDHSKLPSPSVSWKPSQSLSRSTSALSENQNSKRSSTFIKSILYKLKKISVS